MDSKVIKRLKNLFCESVDNGLLLGGNRFGVDSHVGYQEGRGIDLGSMLKVIRGPY